MPSEGPSSDDVQPPQPVSQIRSLFEGIAARSTSQVVPPTTPRRIHSDVPQKPPVSPILAPRLDLSTPATPAPPVELAVSLKRAPPPPPSKRGLPSSPSKGSSLAPSPPAPEAPSRPAAAARPLPSRASHPQVQAPVPTKLLSSNGIVANSLASVASEEADLLRTPPEIGHGDPAVLTSGYAAADAAHDIVIVSHPSEDARYENIALSAPSVLGRKVPPPPPKRPQPSRSPSPHLPASPHPPELPIRRSRPPSSIQYDIPPGPSAVPMMYDADDSSSNAFGSSDGSTALSITSPSTEVDDNPAVHAYPGIGERRGSLPVAVLRHGQLETEHMGMERSVTDHTVATRDSLRPVPPPRVGLGNRPSMPPRPPTRKASPTHLTPPGSTLPPPLPSRNGSEHALAVTSDDDASSSSATTAIATSAPPPLPRRIPPAHPETSKSASPVPPPSHPGIGIGRTTLPGHAHHGGSLHHSISKVKNVLALAGSSRASSSERPRSASGRTPGASAMLDRDALADSPTAQDAAPLPPPPVRMIALGERLPPPRKSNPAPASGSGDDDAESASSSGMEDGESRTVTSNQTTSSTALPTRHKTLDDSPDSSRSNRRPPYRLSTGESLRFTTPHKSVTALSGGVFCVGRHELAVYDLSPRQSDSSSEPHRRKSRHFHRKKQSESSPSSSTSPPPHSNTSLPAPTFLIDLKNVKGLVCYVDSPVITAMEFTPGCLDGETHEPGRFLWCGTKDGHLFEFDTTVGEVTAIRPAGHRAAVTHILRYKYAMVTIDEAGKTLVHGSPDVPPTKHSTGSDTDSVVDEGWTDLGGGAGSTLMTVSPRIARVADKQAFARILYGKLWTSAGCSSSESAMAVAGSAASAQAGGPSSSSASGRGPIVRVYDIFNAVLPSRENSDTMSITTTPDSTKPGIAYAKAATLLSTEAGVGAVTAGAAMIKCPGLVFLGHEGGYVTIWEVSPTVGNSSSTSLGTTDSGGTSYPPRCIQTMKISTTDVLCLEGIHDKLWTGSRNGMICVYDVEAKPWVLSNMWRHTGADFHLDDGKPGLPVYKLMVDVEGMATTGELLTMSVGRDEMSRVWDGFLGLNWIDNELQKQEASFSTFRPVKMLICTWNIDAAKPEALNKIGNGNGTTNLEFFDNLLSSVDQPDIIVFGFQEMIDLENRKLTAKTVLLGSKNGDKVSRSYKLWNDRLVYAVRLAMPPDCPYSVIHTESLVGLFTCIFIKNSVKDSLKDMAITTVKRGMGGHYGNKGAIVARFVIDDSSFCFINCHLAAGQSHKAARNQDLAAVLEEKSVFRERTVSDDAVVFAGGGDGSMVLDHEFVFLNGDLNYRIDQRREAVISNIKAGDFQYLLNHDQLLKEMKTNRGFRLRTFHEAPITFAPTYKYDRFTNQYDTSEKRRVPAWCDRILYRCRDPARVETLHYKRYEVNVSDHRPVSAAFTVKAKKVDYTARQEAEVHVRTELQAHQQAWIAEAVEFYAQLGFI